MNPLKSATAMQRAEAGEFAPTAGPLADANIGFHYTYERLVEETLAEFGTVTPVIVLLGDDLNLVYDGSTQTERVIPDVFHQLKSLSHISFGVQLTLMYVGNAAIDDAIKAELDAKRAHIQAAYQALPDLPTDIQDVPRKVLDETLRLIDEVLARGEVDMGRLEAYAEVVAPLLMQNVGFAVRMELDRIHNVVAKWRRQMGEANWQKLFVVICAQHQPRYRHAARQYFSRLLHEPEGIAAEREERIIFGEGIKEIEAALDLLARHLIDQKASAIIFGNKERLQKDLLADLAAQYVAVLFPDEE